MPYAYPEGPVSHGDVRGGFGIPMRHGAWLHILERKDIETLIARGKYNKRPR